MSNQIKHTPAPWLASRGHDEDPTRWGIVTGVEPHYLIAIVENGAPGDFLSTEAVNARLIAAAPELLEACEAGLAWLDAQPSRTGTAAQMRAAIAKAKGETP